MARADFRLSHSLRVRWSEVDPQNIVFNPNYLVYFDVGASEYWRALGFTYPGGFSELGLDTFAVSAKIDFHRSARYDDFIDVCVRTTRIGRTSLRLALEIHRADEHLVSGELVYVIADPRTQKPMPIPDALREAIVRYEPAAPEQ
jgi:acyl-CoA thioester hydrolase